MFISTPKNSRSRMRLRVGECGGEELDGDGLSAPLANLDIDEFMDSFISEETSRDSSEHTEMNIHLIECDSKCGSLEDLVKSFDKNVKECFTKYKNIDVGQLAPVQVRSQDDIINDSQIWYTLTGNFGDLLPINYWTKPSLIRKYHSESLDLILVKSINSKSLNKSFSKANKNRPELDLNLDSFENILNEFDSRNEHLNELDENYNSQQHTKSQLKQLNLSNISKPKDLVDEDFLDFDIEEEEEENSDDEEEEEEDLDELREQLDMHSIILSKSLYESAEFDEPILTAEQVLDEIDTIINMEDYCDEMTPDSGFYPSSASSMPLNSSLCSSVIDLPIESNNLSYIKYVNTFAMPINNTHSNNLTDNGCLLQNLKKNNNNINNNNENNNNNHNMNVSNVQLNHEVLIVPDQATLKKMNIFELNELIEQIEHSTKILSDTLVAELALREELEFEKETRNTFITLLNSIQEKRRLLSLESFNTKLSMKKKQNRKSMSIFDLSPTSSTYLTTVIPFNNEIEYTVQHLEILNKLLRAINKDSHQVPELLTNYILKVVCPT